MALVSYSVSDESGSDEEDVVPEITVQLKTPTEKIEVKNVAGDQEDKNALFSVLPTPKTKSLVLDSELSTRLLLNKPTVDKSKKKSIKISVPSLSDFDDDLPRPLTKKVEKSGKGSKLFDLLPPPKHTGPAVALKLIPDKLKVKKVIPAKFLKQPGNPTPKPVVTPAPEIEDDSEDEETGDFFSLNKPAEPEPIVEIPMVEITPEVSGLSEVTNDSIEMEYNEDTSSYPTGDFVPIVQEELTLDDEAIQKLCGGGKRKRTAVNAEIIDVAERDIIPDKNEWLMKALTEQKRKRSHKKNTGPSSQQKRKHQITYLAFQAKEHEEELQNQWASNRMTKKQTQSKYGF